MYFEKIDEFYQTLVNSEHFNEELKSKLQKRMHDEKEYKIFIQNELIPLAKSMGYDLSVDDILSYEHQKLQNLSEEELESVIGGTELMKNLTTTFLSALAIAGGAYAMHSLNSAQAMAPASTTSTTKQPQSTSENICHKFESQTTDESESLKKLEAQYSYVKGLRKDIESNEEDLKDISTKMSKVKTEYVSNFKNIIDEKNDDETIKTATEEIKADIFEKIRNVLVVKNIISKDTPLDQITLDDKTSEAITSEAITSEATATKIEFKDSIQKAIIQEIQKNKNGKLTDIKISMELINTTDIKNALSAIRAKIRQKNINLDNITFESVDDYVNRYREITDLIPDFERYLTLLNLYTKDIKERENENKSLWEEVEKSPDINVLEQQKNIAENICKEKTQILDKMKSLVDQLSRTPPTSQTSKPQTLPNQTHQQSPVAQNPSAQPAYIVPLNQKITRSTKIPTATSSAPDDTSNVTYDKGTQTLTINNFEFSDEDYKVILQNEIKNIVLDTNITTIPKYAFVGWFPYLKTIKGEKITDIEANAFDGSSVKTVNFPAVENIANQAFRNCNNLKDISIPLTAKYDTSIFEGVPYDALNTTFKFYIDDRSISPIERPLKLTEKLYIPEANFDVKSYIDQSKDDTMKGEYYLSLGQADLAITHLQKAVKNGYSRAMVLLGDCFMNGSGSISKNPLAALSLYKACDEINDTEAMIRLGDYYYENDAIEDAIEKAQKYYVKAWFQKNINALIRLIDYFPAEYSVEKNFKELNISKLSASSIADFHFHLGRFYQLGLLKPDGDDDTPIKQYEQAAELGHSGAMNELGNLYYNLYLAYQIPNDLSDAFYYWNKAAQRGNPEANFNFTSRLSSESEKIERDNKKLSYFLESIDLLINFQAAKTGYEQKLQELKQNLSTDLDETIKSQIDRFVEFMDDQTLNDYKPLLLDDNNLYSLFYKRCKDATLLSVAKKQILPLLKIKILEKSIIKNDENITLLNEELAEIRPVPDGDKIEATRNILETMLPSSSTTPKEKSTAPATPTKDLRDSSQVLRATVQPSSLRPETTTVNKNHISKISFTEANGMLAIPPTELIKNYSGDDDDADFIYEYDSMPVEMRDIEATKPLFDHYPQATDVSQAGIGDCYFLTALMEIANNDPQAILKSIRDNGDNTVTVRFYDTKTRVPKYYKIKKSIPIDPEYRDPDAAPWVGLFEKAYVIHKAHEKKLLNLQNYSTLDTGYSGDALCTITGTDAFDRITKETLPKENPAQKLFEKIESKISTYNITCSFNSNIGIYDHHAYAILGTRRVQTKGGIRYYIIIRNPHGTNIPQLEKNPNDCQYELVKLINSRAKHRQGVFILSAEFFYNIFNNVTFVSKGIQSSYE